MRLYLKRRVPGGIEFGLIYSGLAVSALLLVKVLPIDHFLPSCVFKGLTGIPCPTCGATRSLLFFSHGDLLRSLAMNPLVSLGLLAACIVFPTQLLTLLLGSPRIGLMLSEQEKRLAPAVVVALLVVQWIYLILVL